MPPEINFYNPRSLILFICILQGVIFAVLLFSRSRKERDISDFWLGLLLLVMCTSLITHFIGFANVYDNNQFLTYFPFELVFAHAPTVYLYVLSLTDSDRELTPRDLLFFVPTALHFVYRFALFLQSMEFKDWWGDSTYNTAIVFVIDIGLYVWNAVFLYLSFSHYMRYRAWLNDNFSDTEAIKFKWLRNFLLLFLIVFVLEACFGIFGLISDLTYIQAFYLKLIFALSTYYLAIAGFLRSKRIKVDFRAEEKTVEKQSADGIKENAAKLEKVIAEERPYLDPDITLRKLAKTVGLNSSKLSETINKGFGKNFNDFINEHRIETVKRLIETTPNSTLLEIAFESGFNSKATFNRSFKKFTGISPGEYVKTQNSSE